MIKKIVVYVLLAALLSGCAAKRVEAPALQSTDAPAVQPTEAVTPRPTETVARQSTEAPTAQPTEEATSRPTDAAMLQSTEVPTAQPTEAVISQPTEAVAIQSTEAPTAQPTESVTSQPTETATLQPTETAARQSTDAPTAQPTEEIPTPQPTENRANSGDAFSASVLQRETSEEVIHADFNTLQVTGSMELKYARQFSADYLSDGSVLINITDGGRFLLIPEGQEPPNNINADITVLRQPVANIYLAATSSMCLFDSLGALGNISMSGTKAEGWYIPNARAAMERGEIVYAGRYSAPDYELIMAAGCGLAIESTMITHAPEVKEKLNEIGVPVLVERSSYETHPLGRTEWIRLYGLLTGKDALAEQLFTEQARYVENISSTATGKTAAFFYISSAGTAVVRKGSDYVAEMIELAGGTYAFTGLGEGEGTSSSGGSTATGSANMDMESFYVQAKDADVIIYNSSIDGEVASINELLSKSHLLSDFKAVREGNVWCTNKNLFQETTEFGLMISDMNQIFTGQVNADGDLNFLYRLR